MTVLTTLGNQFKICLVVEVCCLPIGRGMEFEIHFDLFYIVFIFEAKSMVTAPFLFSFKEHWVTWRPGSASIDSFIFFITLKCGDHIFLRGGVMLGYCTTSVHIHYCMHEYILSNSLNIYVSLVIQFIANIEWLVILLFACTSKVYRKVMRKDE